MTVTIYVTNHFPATRLVEAGEGPVYLVNIDPANTIWCGDDNTIEAGDLTATIALGPLASVAVDGKNDFFGIGNAAAGVPVNKISGGIGFNPGILNITGNVTANVSGNVNIAGGTVGITTSAPIDVSAATVTVDTLKNDVLVNTSGQHNTGTSFADAAIAMPQNAEGYEVVVNQVVHTANFMVLCDITISHLDNNNNVLYSEAFTVSNIVSNLATSGFQSMIIRGLLHGTKIQISGFPCTGGIINTILGSAGLSGSSVTVATYAVKNINPNAPKRSSPNWDGVIVNCPSTPIAAGNNFIASCADYSGPAIVNTVNLGANNVNFLFRSYSALFAFNNAGAQLYTTQVPVVTAGNRALDAVNFDNYFHTLIAVAATGGSTISGIITGETNS